MASLFLCGRVSKKRRRKSLIWLRCSVSSAISCIVIKSDRGAGKIPLSGEIVRVDGRSGFFTVMNVDRLHRIAQVMEQSGEHRLSDVPFVSVRLVNPDSSNLSEVVRRFLDAKDEADRRDRDRS